MSNKEVLDGHWYVSSEGKVLKFTGSRVLGDKLPRDCRKVIATNNPNMDIPQVVDDYIRKLSQEYRDKISIQLEYDKPRKVTTALHIECGFYDGYNKSKETHPFSEEELKNFATHFYTRRLKGIEETLDSSLRIWKEQQPKIAYYEN